MLRILWKYLPDKALQCLYNKIDVQGRDDKRNLETLLKEKSKYVFVVVTKQVSRLHVGQYCCFERTESGINLYAASYTGGMFLIDRDTRMPGSLLPKERYHEIAWSSLGICEQDKVYRFEPVLYTFDRSVFFNQTKGYK